MKQVQALLKQGELIAATERAVVLLRDDPANADVRALYIELLCIQGALEKADQQLDMMVRQHPDYLVGAVNLRQLIRAASARQDFYQGGMTVKLFKAPDAMFETLLSLHLSVKEQDTSAAAQAAVKLEKLRSQIQVDINGAAVSDIRDLDDTLAGYLELFGTDGHYYLAKFNEIDSLQLKKPASVLDAVWRRAEIVIKDGPQGEVFVPMTYINSVRVAERLGKETNWQQHHEHLVTGLGHKMLMAGEQVLALSDIRTLSAIESAVSA
ncbi:MAG: type VI secretion system accessory protein TagJ [Rheinheimera sp.]|nr:type VI secretion system accessory protein TagJ [Rheinheimera sp.]